MILQSITTHPYILALDSASEKCSVAISKGPNNLYEIIEHKSSMASEYLVQMTENCLAKANISLNQVNYLVVTKGPGSFTGLRIALSIAQGFLIALKSTIPIVFDSFQYYHYRASKQVAYFDYNVVVLDAYRAGAYVSINDCNGNPLFPPQIYTSPELLEILRSITKDKIIIVSGNCIEKFYDEAKHHKNIIILPRFIYTRAKILCEMAFSAVQNNEFNSVIEPYYIAPVNAKLPSVK